MIILRTLNGQRVAPRLLGDRRQHAPFLDLLKHIVLFKVF